MRLILGVMLLAGAIALSPKALADPVTISDDRIDIYRVPKSNAFRLMAQATFDCRRRKLWNLLREPEKFSEYMPRVVESRYLGSSDKVKGGKPHVFMNLTVPWPIKNVVNVLELDWQSKHHILDWRLIRGTLKVNDGRVALAKVRKGTFIEIDVTMDMGRAIPRWLMSWVANSYFPKVFRAIADRLNTL